MGSDKEEDAGFAAVPPKEKIHFYAFSKLEFIDITKWW